MKVKRFSILMLVLAALVGAMPAEAAFISYVIRKNPTTGDAPTIVASPSQTEFIISQGSQKAGLGSSDIDGRTIGDIVELSIKRLDDPGRFADGSGPNVAPYFNIWITDGAGKFAVVANEPSDAIFQPLYNGGYSLSFADLANKPAKIFETSDKSWLPNNGVGLTFADLAAFVIQAPTTAQLTAGWPGLGTGAPRELGTNQAYGVNWVFGDTLSNYVSGDRGYIVADARVRAVPEPTTLLLLGLGLAAAGRKLRRR